MKKTAKIRYAIIGLGHLSQVAILPAFGHTRRSELAALVSGDSAKGRVLSKRYGVPAYHYDDFEVAVEKEGVDAAFIVLPNTQHRQFTERAAKATRRVVFSPRMGTDGTRIVGSYDELRMRIQ